MCRAWWRPTSTSACTASSAACCARRWSAPTCRRPSGCTAPRPSCGSWVSCCTWTLSPSSSARSTPPSSRCGTCGVRSRKTSSAPPTSAWWPARPTRAACGTSWKMSWVCPATSPSRARPGPRPTTPRCGAWCTKRRRWCCLAPTTSACTWPRRLRALARSRPTSRRRSRAPSSVAPPAPRSWVTPAPPTWSRSSATRCLMRCSTSCRWAPSSTGWTPRQRVNAPRCLGTTTPRR